MKCFVLCGGYGTRLNNGKPGELKPAIKIINKPIIKHILDIYSKHVTEFYLLAGYKIEDLRKIDFKSYKAKVSVINTGLGTSTADRLRKVKSLLKKRENFYLTYGDSLANFKPSVAMRLKKNNNYVMSIYKYYPSYGILKVSKNLVNSFDEKSKFFYINAGFYILDETVFNFISNKKNLSLEKDLIPNIKKKKKICTYEVKKWLPMDTLSDKLALNSRLKKNKNFFKF